MITARRTVRTVAASLTVLAALALGGCGIRPTPVPVDAGSAPSRVSCTPPRLGGERPSGDETVRTSVFLVCSGEVIAVERAVPSPGRKGGTTRLETARALLDELRKPPSRAEDEAGFGSSVPEDLEVRGPAEGDPDEALRLSQEPDGLPPFALAQIVCTFAGTDAAGREDSVVLAGPAGDGADGRPMEYSCTRALRGGPEATKPTGSPVPG